MIFGLDGRVVMQRPAKPLTPVRFRIQPPLLELIFYALHSIIIKKGENTCPSGGIGRHKGLKIPR